MKLLPALTKLLPLPGMKSTKPCASLAIRRAKSSASAIAGVLAMRPQCLVLDEPTAMLDPHGSIKEVLTTVHKLNKEENITVIYITHFMEEAVTADRVIVMVTGKNNQGAQATRYFCPCRRNEEVRP